MSVTDEIKQRLDIVEVISEYVTLQKSGKNFKAPCPFHSEKHASFFVFPDKQSWHCFGACGTGGDIFSFVMKKEGIDFGQALHILAEKAGVSLSNPTDSNKNKEYREKLLEINEATSEYFHHSLLTSPAGEIARNYIKKRAISPDIVKTFLLGYSHDDWDALQQYLLLKGYTLNDLAACGLILERQGGGYYDRFRNRLMFPIHDIQGRIIGFGARALDDAEPKYLNSPQTLLFDKSNTLYGAYHAKTAIRQQNFAIITEGYMDVLTSHQYGWTNTIASMGTALTISQLDILKKLTRNIVIALDADMAGEQAIKRFASTTDIEQILDSIPKVAIPQYGKDPDESIRKNPESWKESISNANNQPLLEFVIDTLVARTNISTADDKLKLIETLQPLIANISKEVRRWQALEQLAHSLKIDIKVLNDYLNQIKHSKKPLNKQLNRNNSRTHQFTPFKPISTSSPIEEYCLALLLQFPDLRSKNSDLLPEYFEQPENHEIFLKWQSYDIIDDIINNVVPALQPSLEKLLTRSFPTTIKDNETYRIQAFNDCSNRLKEKYLRNIEIKKQELLAAAVETDGVQAELTKLEEQGIKSAEGLKEIFHTPKFYKISRHKRGG